MLHIIKPAFITVVNWNYLYYFKYISVDGTSAYIQNVQFRKNRSHYLLAAEINI